MKIQFIKATMKLIPGDAVGILGRGQNLGGKMGWPVGIGGKFGSGAFFKFWRIFGGSTPSGFVNSSEK